MSTDLGDLFVVLRAKTKQFQTDMKGAAEVLKKHKTGLAAVGAASAALSAGLIMSGKQMAKAASEFEFSITRVGALAKVMPKQVGGISKEFEALKSAARIMGEQTEFSAKEVADGMQFLAMAGFDAKSTIEAMPSVLQLATAGVVDLGTAANITSNVVAAMGMEIKDLAGVNDVLVNAFTSTNTTLASIGESFKFVGPVAKGAGVEFKELTAAIGLLGNMGIQGSMAGTTMRSAIVRLLKPVGLAKDVIKQLGLNTAISGGKITSLVDVIRILEKKGASTTQIMTIFGVQAGAGIAAIVEAGANQLENLTNKLGRTGTAAEIQAALLNTTQGQMKLFTSAVESLQISLGNALLPTLRTVISFFSDLVSRFNALSPSTKAWTVKIGIAVAALSALLSALTGLAAVFPTIVAGFSALAAVAGVVAVPLIAIPVAIAGIILQVGLLRKAWNWNFLGIRTVTFGIIKSIRKQFDMLVAGLKRQMMSMAKVLDVLADPVGAARGKTGAITGTLEEVFKGEGLIYTAKKAGDLLSLPFKSAGQLIKDGFSNGVNLFGDLINKALPKSMKDGMGKALADLTKGLSGGVVAGVKGPRGPGVGTAAAAMDLADEMQFGKGIMAEIAADMEVIGKVFKKGAEEIKENFPKLIKSMDIDIGAGQRKILASADARQKQVAFAIKQAAAMTHDLDADVRAAVDSLRGSFRGISATMVGIAGVGMELVGRMGDGGAVISNIVRGFQKGGLFGGIATAAIEILSRAKSFKKISKILSDILANLADAFGPLLDVLVPILDLLNTLVKVLKPFIKALSALSTGLGKGLYAIGRGLKKLGGKITKGFSKLPGMFGQMFKKANEKLSGDLDNAADDIAGWWDDPRTAPAVKEFANPWDEFANKIRSELGDVSTAEGIDEVRQRVQDWYDEMVTRLQKALRKGLISEEEAVAQAAEIQDTFNTLMDQIGDTTTGLEEMAENVEDVNEALTNVPEGYKVALTRFRAMTAEGEAGGFTPFGNDRGLTGTSASLTMNVENLNVTANDPTKMREQLESEAEWRSYTVTGSSIVGNNQSSTTTGVE